MINSIGIKNFKSIINIEVELPPFCAVIGSNAAGKTNLIQAINFIKRLVTGTNIYIAQRKISLLPQELFNFNELSKEIFFRITIETKNNREYELVIKINLVNNHDLSQLIIRYEKLEKIIHNDGKKEKVKIYEREGEVLKNQEGKDIPLAVDSDALAISVYKNNEAVEVKRFFSNVFITEQEMIDSRKSIASMNQDSLAGLLVHLRHRDLDGYEQFKKIVSKILPDFNQFVEFDVEKKPGVKEDTSEEKNLLVLLEEKNLKGKLSMKSISGGDLRTLYLIARAIDMKEGSSLFIEEIENGIHPKRLSDLLEHLDTISKRRDLQIIFTTHSPNVINNFKPSGILFVRKDKNEGTKLKIIEEYSEIEPIKKFLNKGGKLLDYITSRFS